MLKQEIQSAINSAYENPTEAALSVPRKDSVPTIKELVQYLKEKLPHG